jgi:hypothetical protein
VYVGNNPLVRIDPTGLMDVADTGSYGYAAAAAGAAMGVAIAWGQDPDGSGLWDAIGDFFADGWRRFWDWISPTSDESGSGDNGGEVSNANSDSTTSADSSAQPPDPDDDDNSGRGSRNQPQRTGEPNSRQIEYNDDGSVRRITEYDENGHWTREIRPGRPGVRHGVEGPTTKYPTYNTNPTTGVEYENVPDVRASTPEEIDILNQAMNGW